MNTTDTLHEKICAIYSSDQSSLKIIKSPISINIVGRGADVSLVLSEDAAFRLTVSPPGSSTRTTSFDFATKREVIVDRTMKEFIQAYE